MPQGIYSQVLCTKYVKNANLINDNPFPLTIPKPHQQAVVDFFVKDGPHKGILLFHELGSGKTCTSILIADEMLQRKMVRHVFVITPGSLRANWIIEYCTKCGSNRLTKDYTFITYNYDVSKQLDTLDFNKCLIIIDESHNVIQGFRNEEQTKNAIIHKINESRCKVIMLSATPFYNHTYEWTVLGNILKPNVFKSVFKDEKVDLDSWAAEEQRITDQMLRGIVSYFPGNRNDYPTVTREAPVIITNVPDRYRKMLQNVLRMEQRTALYGPPKPELALEDPGLYKQRFTRFMMSVQYMLSRQLSNLYVEGRNTRKVKLPDDVETTITLPDLPVEKGGWMTKELLANPGLDVLSPKMAALIRNMIQPDHLGRKHVIYSKYKNNGGIYFLKTLFEWCGVSFVLFTGDESEPQRIRVLEQFNDPSNRFGQKIKVLLMTEAGIEGITLKDVGHMHLLESHNIGGKMEQAIGRVARYESHINMPDDMKTVSIWRYFVRPAGEDVSVDQILFENAERNNNLLKQFYDRLIENSIENSDDYDEENMYLY